MRDFDVLRPTGELDGDAIEADMAPTVGQDRALTQVYDDKSAGIATVDLLGDPLLKRGGGVIREVHIKVPP